jgi:hypothetical protein
MGGIYQTHETRAQAASDKAQASKDRQALDQDRVQAKQDRAIKDALLGDAKQRLQALQDRVDRLQTKAETQELSKELTDVKRKLIEAESKLEGPKAKFVATFATPYYDQIPVVETDGERVSEGIKFTFGVENVSDVAATNGEIVLQICAACSFAIEPSGGFIKPTIGPDTERVRAFSQIQEHAVMQDMTVVVVAPIGAGPYLVVGLAVKCTTCEPSKFQVLKVRIPPLTGPDFRTKPPVKSKAITKPFQP